MYDDDKIWLEYIKNVKKLEDMSRITKEKFQEQISENYFDFSCSNMESIIEKIDLHGLTEEQAFTELKNFLEYCYNNGKKKALIITGKGKIGNPGVIKLAVPRWLAYTEIKKYILSYSEAKYKFGGSGAIAVLLKKKPKQEHYHDK